MSSAHSVPEPLRKFTVEEYLAFERASDERHEYLYGEILPMNRHAEGMAGEKLPHGEHFRRQRDDTWNLQEAFGLEATAVLSSISCTLKLADVYDRIKFAEEASEAT